MGESRTVITKNDQDQLRSIEALPDLGPHRDWTDPEIGATAMDVIRRWDYPVEEYNVTTEDGYILKVLRIPHGRLENATSTKPRPVVFMQHGLESSCMDWLANLPQQSAGYIFADQGFDVWMGNFRGNIYSTGHIKYKNTEHEYWRFSWDEMARYDLPAMIGTVQKVTGAKQIYYMGHSMGTTTIMGKLSQDPDFGKNIKKIYAMAPVGTLTTFKGPAKLMAEFSGAIQKILSVFGIDDLFPTSKIQVDLARYLCGSVITEMFCSNLLMALTGPESKQMNDTRLPVYLSHTPAGTSIRTVLHYAQVHNAKQFQMYDYGSKTQNQQAYGQPTPPVYDVDKIRTTPIALYWGGQDWLADPDDVEGLIPKLRTLFGNVYLPHFNHMDFIWGLRAAPEIYIPIHKDIADDFAGIGL